MGRFVNVNKKLVSYQMTQLFDFPILWFDLTEFDLTIFPQIEQQYNQGDWFKQFVTSYMEAQLNLSRCF